MYKIKSMDRDLLTRHTFFFGGLAARVCIGPSLLAALAARGLVGAGKSFESERPMGPDAAVPRPPRTDS